MISFKELVEAGVHFGHQSSRWSPKMKQYIWGSKSGIHLIDVSKTAHALECASHFLKGIASEGKNILWLGTKKPAQVIMKDAGVSLDMPFVDHRWIGGTLTNHTQVKKSITKMLHLEDIVQKSDRMSYTKKELNVFQKALERLQQNVGGLRNMHWPIGAIVLVDVRKEYSAIREAAMMGVPVIALVDTNSDPSLVDYVIPANDDSPRSIGILIKYLAQAVHAGKAEHAHAEQEAAEKRKHDAETKKAAAEKAKKESANANVDTTTVTACSAKKAVAKNADEETSAAKSSPKKAATKTAEEKQAVSTKKPAAKKAGTPKPAAKTSVKKATTKK